MCQRLGFYLFFNVSEIPFLPTKDHSIGVIVENAFHQMLIKLLDVCHDLAMVVIHAIKEHFHG